MILSIGKSYGLYRLLLLILFVFLCSNCGFFHPEEKKTEISEKEIIIDFKSYKSSITFSVPKEDAELITKLADPFAFSSKRDVRIVFEDKINVRLGNIIRGADDFALVSLKEAEGLKDDIRSKIVAVGGLERYLHIVTSKSTQIRGLDQLKGKRISIGPKYSETETAANHLLDAIGLTNLVKCQTGDFGDQPEMLMKKMIDVFMVLAEIPCQNVSLVGENLQLIQVEPDIVLEMEKRSNNPYRPGFIPTKVYLPKQPKNYIKAVKVIDYIVASPSLDEKYVYSIMKSIIKFNSAGKTRKEALITSFGTITEHNGNIQPHKVVFKSYKQFFEPVKERD